MVYNKQFSFVIEVFTVILFLDVLDVFMTDIHFEIGRRTVYEVVCLFFLYFFGLLAGHD